MSTEDTSEMYPWAEESDATPEELAEADAIVAADQAPLDYWKTESTTVLIDPHGLHPHPRNREVYGDMAPPADLLASIAEGWSPTSIIEALPDGTILKGHLRRFAAIQLEIAQVPVHYRADLTDDEAAQVAELLRDNTGRVKTNEIVCREWRLAWNTFKDQQGSMPGEKSRDVVGRQFGKSGVTLEHGIAVVTALDGKGLDMDTREKVRSTLNERGIEPAWKLLRKQAPAGSESPMGDDSEQAEIEEVSLVISSAKRQKALLDVLAAIDSREDALEDVQAVAQALPRENLEEMLVRVEFALRLLGNIEGEIRDRLEVGRRKPSRPSRRSKSGV